MPGDSQLPCIRKWSSQHRHPKHILNQCTGLKLHPSVDRAIVLNLSKQDLMSCPTACSQMLCARYSEQAFLRHSDQLWGPSWAPGDFLPGRKTADTYLMPELKMNDARPPLSLPSANRHNFICTGNPPEIKGNW